MSELHTEHVRIDTTSDGQLVVEPNYVEFLRSQGHTIEGVTELSFPESSSRDVCHMVVKVDTYELPKGHPSLDYEEHRITIPVCSCEGFRYTYSADVSDPEVFPTDCEPCPHIESVDKVTRAQNDENQESLA